MIIEKPFPHGLAAINRLISYSKGLAVLSGDVEVLCLKPTEDINGKIRNKEISGVYEGIRFQYMAGTTIKPSQKAYRIFLYLKGVFRTVYYIVSTSRRRKIDAVFMGNSNFPITFMFFLLSKIFNIKFIHERSEYPFLSYQNSLLKKLQLKIYLNITLKLFDGLIVITRHLKDYFKPLLRKDTPILILPILVEPERFDKTRSFTRSKRNIVYCGSMEGDKDGVPILIEAFGLIATKYKDLDLVLIGETKFDSFEQLIRKISALKIEDRVQFTGRVEREEIPRLLSSADILVLARPANIQAKGGFPTKLGEYLATGIPVIVTRVGTIPEYLQDKKNAFIAEPDSAEEFAKKIEYVLTNPEEAEQVGQEGKKLTQTIFNYKYQANNIIHFIKSI